MTIENKKNCITFLNNLIFNYKSRKVRYNKMNFIINKVSKKILLKRFYKL